MRGELLRPGEGGVESGGGAVACPKIEGRRIFDPGAGGGAPVGEVGGCEGEVNGSLRVGGDGDAAEAFQLADGAGGAAVLLVDVELGDLVSSNGASVFHVDGHVDGLPCLALRLGDLQVGEGKGAIAETIAKGIKRRAWLVPVALALLAGILGEVVGIVDGNLADIAGPAEG